MMMIYSAGGEVGGGRDGEPERSPLLIVEEEFSMRRLKLGHKFWAVWSCLISSTMELGAWSFEARAWAPPTRIPEPFFFRNSIALTPLQTRHRTVHPWVPTSLVALLPLSLKLIIPQDNPWKQIIITRSILKALWGTIKTYNLLKIII